MGAMFMAKFDRALVTGENPDDDIQFTIDSGTVNLQNIDLDYVNQNGVNQALVNDMKQSLLQWASTLFHLRIISIVSKSDTIKAKSNLSTSICRQKSEVEHGSAPFGTNKICYSSSAYIPGTPWFQRSTKQKNHMKNASKNTGMLLSYSWQTKVVPELEQRIGKNVKTLSNASTTAKTKACRHMKKESLPKEWVEISKVNSFSSPSIAKQWQTKNSSKNMEDYSHNSPDTHTTSGSFTKRQMKKSSMVILRTFGYQAKPDLERHLRFITI